MTSSLERIRALAVGFPETTEASHFDTPDFRVRGKIFATARHDAPRAVLKLPPHIQEAMIESRPEAFSPTPGRGRHGWTFVETDKVDPDLLKDLVDLAWRQVAPKKLAADRAAGLGA